MPINKRKGLFIFLAFTFLYDLNSRHILSFIFENHPVPTFTSKCSIGMSVERLYSIGASVGGFYSVGVSVGQWQGVVREGFPEQRGKQHPREAWGRGGRNTAGAWLAAAEGKEEISRTLLPVKALSSFQTGIVFPVSGSLSCWGPSSQQVTSIDLHSQFKYFLPVKVFQFSPLSCQNQLPFFWTLPASCPNRH